MVDLITVVFEEEIPTLKTQAKSIDVYGRNINRIFVVINDSEKIAQLIDTSWWGGLSNNVEIIHRNQFGSTWSDNGWLSQQALKLLTATRAPSEWSMILDAKTFFVRDMYQFASLPAVGHLDIYPVFKPSQDIVNDLFNINLDKQLGPGGVPFIINNQEARDMVEWIELKTGINFAKWFQAQGMLTEFILYSGWIQYRYGGFEKLYNVKDLKIRPSNLCHSEVSSFDRKFREMQSRDTVSIHRRAWTQLNQQQQKLYTDFLISRGIQ